MALTTTTIKVRDRSSPPKEVSDYPSETQAHAKNAKLSHATLHKQGVGPHTLQNAERRSPAEVGRISQESLSASKQAQSPQSTRREQRKGELTRCPSTKEKLERPQK
eukprot:1100718-Rhodomonas_salina.1